jgi:hypothetical protein
MCVHPNLLMYFKYRSEGTRWILAKHLNFRRPGGLPKARL